VKTGIFSTVGRRFLLQLGKYTWKKSFIKSVRYLTGVIEIPFPDSGKSDSFALPGMVQEITASLENGF
jgi:hypothetical protein